MSEMSNAEAELKLKKYAVDFVEELLRQRKLYEAGCFSALMVLFDEGREVETFRTLVKLTGLDDVLKRCMEEE